MKIKHSWKMRLNGMNFGRLVVAIVVVVVLVYYLLLPGTVSRTIKLNKCIRTLVHGQKKLRCNEPFLMNVSEYHAILASFDPSSSSNIVMILFSMFFFFMLLLHAFIGEKATERFVSPLFLRNGTKKSRGYSFFNGP